MNRISRKSLGRRKRRSLGRRSKVSRRRSRVSRRRSKCNSRRLKQSCNRRSRGKKRCSWVKRKSSGRRRHRGYCKRGGSGQTVYTAEKLADMKTFVNNVKAWSKFGHIKLDNNKVQLEIGIGDLKAKGEKKYCWTLKHTCGPQERRLLSWAAPAECCPTPVSWQVGWTSGPHDDGSLKQCIWFIKNLEVDQKGTNVTVENAGAKKMFTFDSVGQATIFATKIKVLFDGEDADENAALEVLGSQVHWPENANYHDNL